MTITYNNFKSKIYETVNLADSFIYHDKRVTVSKDLNVSIDSLQVAIKFASLKEAVQYSKDLIDSRDLLSDADVIPEAKIVDLIRKHNAVDKITSQVVESYASCIASKNFTIDPVVTEIKSTYSNSQFNKLEYILDDRTTIALDEQTILKLRNISEDKYNLVEHMRESKENFMQVIRQLEE